MTQTKQQTSQSHDAFSECDFDFSAPKIEQICIDGFKFSILRDDLLGVFNGNKARKLHYYLNADLSKFKKIVCYGSSQSNAMYSLSLFAKLKGLDFEFVCEHISSNLRDNPCGNFALSLQNGMKIHEHERRREFALSLCDEKTLFIEEGVAQSEAEFGFAVQGEFIDNFATTHGREFDIFLPSGTGTSAAYLARHTKFSVFSTPCVGDTEYLKKQILSLVPNSNVRMLPSTRKFHFAKPYRELYEIWQKARIQTSIEFDLIYDPVGLLTLLENQNIFKNEVLYIHQGGVLGNISQLQRYKYKFKINKT